MKLVLILVLAFLTLVLMLLLSASKNDKKSMPKKSTEHIPVVLNKPAN